jgi:hypothetical protein
MNGIKFLLVWAVVAVSGFVCVPCDAAEPCQPARIVQQKGPWVLVQRGSECYWLYDARDAHCRLHRAGKKIVTGTFNIVGCAVETAGDIVVGTGSIVVGVGTEILDRGDCAVRCLLRLKCRPCGNKPAAPTLDRVKPPVNPEDLKPPKIDIGEPSSSSVWTFLVR